MNNFAVTYSTLRSKRQRRMLIRTIIAVFVAVISYIGYLGVQRIMEHSGEYTQKAIAKELEVAPVTVNRSETAGSPPAVSHLPVLPERIISNVKLDVPVYIQQRALSCEAAALKMALMYKGINVSENEIMSIVGFDLTPHRGTTWGNPHRAFVGDIDGRQPTTGYGVYWEPIARAGAKYRPNEYFTHGTVQTVVNEIIKGNPVVVWGNAASGRRVDWQTPDGETIRAISGEHALTVTGFRGTQDHPTHVIYNDPHSGEVVQTVSEFESQWSLLGHAGVIVR